MEKAATIEIPAVKMTDDQRYLLSRLYPWRQGIVKQEVRTKDFPFVRFGPTGGNHPARIKLQKAVAEDNDEEMYLSYYELIHLAVRDTMTELEPEVLARLGIRDYTTAACFLRMQVDVDGQLFADKV